MRAFVAAFAITASCAVALAASGPLANHPRQTLALFLVAGASWIVALTVARTAVPRTSVIVGGAILLRVIALASNLNLTDDPYRYLWEGELIVRGISPYARAHDAPELETVRRDVPGLFARVAHVEVASVYPPVAQCAAVAAVTSAHVLGVPVETGGVFALRCLAALADLLILIPLARLGARAGSVSTALVAWGFCPLIVFEFAGSAHFDALGILLLCLALVALPRTGESASSKRTIGASALLALAVLVKYLPLFVLPFLGSKRRVLVALTVLAAVALVAFAPFVIFDGGHVRLGAGLVHYGARWEAGSLVFRFVDGAFVRFGASVGLSDAHKAARIVVGCTWLAWAIFVVTRVRDRERGVGLLIAGFLVLSPTLHPWYTIWIVPFVGLRPSMAWMWILAVAPLLYAPLDVWQREGRWVEPAWLWPVVALPFFALLVWSVAVRRAPIALATNP